MLMKNQLWVYERFVAVVCGRIVASRTMGMVGITCSFGFLFPFSRNPVKVLKRPITCSEFIPILICVLFDFQII